MNTEENNTRKHQAGACQTEQLADLAVTDEQSAKTKGGAGQSPMLQGATNGTIWPQASNTAVVQGVNTAGTVRVNNLANLE